MLVPLNDQHSALWPGRTSRNCCGRPDFLSIVETDQESTSVEPRRRARDSERTETVSAVVARLIVTSPAPATSPTIGRALLRIPTRRPPASSRPGRCGDAEPWAARPWRAGPWLNCEAQWDTLFHP